MSTTSLIKEIFFPNKESFLKIGNYTQIGIVFLIIFNYWNVFQLDNIPLPHLVDFMYLYIGLNASALGVFVYLENINKAVEIKLCPRCDTQLETIHHFKCAQCGDITIGTK